MVFFQTSTSENLNQKHSFFKTFLIFTGVFAITALGVFISYALLQETLLWSSDGVLQRYPRLVKGQDLFSQLLSGKGMESWSWDIGLGTDTLGVFRESFLNPTTWIAFLFPVKYLDLGYSISVVLRMYLSGVTFLIFAKKMGLNRFQSIIGGISYAFCSWIIFVANIQGQFLTQTVIFPLIILGVEKIVRKENPALFIIMVFLQIVYSTYFAYMVAIMVIVYFVIRWFTLRNGKSFILLLKDFLIFCAFGIVGLLISAVVLVTTAYSLINVSTSSGSSESVNFLYNLETYIKWVSSFTTGKVFESYSMLALPSICLLMLPILIKKTKSISAIMALICLSMSLFPIFSSFFNGGSYVTGRWYYMLFFFVIWASVDCLKPENFKNRENQLSMIIWIGTLIIFFVISILLDMNSNYEILYGVITILCALIVIIILHRNLTKRLEILLIIVLVVNIVVCNNIVEKRSHQKLGQTYEAYEKSVQERATKIKDSSFYRVDQVEGISKLRVARAPANENMYFGNKSVYTCFSTTNNSWYEFNKSLGNNAGYIRRSYIFSNDNRAAIDFLMGVKYFIGTSDYRKPGASEYAPYGFDVKEKINGVEILENKYSIGIGCLYEKCISRSEFEKLSYFEKEQAILQAIVVPDEQYNVMNSSIKADINNLNFDVEEIDYSVKTTDGVVLSDNKIKLSNREGKIILNPKQILNSQVIVAFKNLKKTPDSNAETQSEKFNDMRFYINCSNGIIKKRVGNSYGLPQGFNDIIDYNINMGYSKNFDGKMTITFNREGEYTFDDIKIYAMPSDNYDINAQKLQNKKFKMSTFKNDFIEGSFDASRDSIAYFSILNNPGWKVYIDGEKADKIENANIAFTGIYIPEGNHKVTLEYDNIGTKYGWPLTVAGIVILIIVCIYYRKKGGQHINEK